MSLIVLDLRITPLRQPIKSGSFNTPAVALFASSCPACRSNSQVTFHDFRLLVHLVATTFAQVVENRCSRKSFRSLGKIGVERLPVRSPNILRMEDRDDVQAHGWSACRTVQLRAGFHGSSRSQCPPHVDCSLCSPRVEIAHAAIPVAQMRSCPLFHFVEVDDSRPHAGPRACPVSLTGRRVATGPALNSGPSSWSQ